MKTNEQKEKSPARKSSLKKKVGKPRSKIDLQKDAKLTEEQLIPLEEEVSDSLPIEDPYETPNYEQPKPGEGP